MREKKETNLKLKYQNVNKPFAFLKKTHEGVKGFAGLFVGKGGVLNRDKQSACQVQLEFSDKMYSMDVSMSGTEWD